MSGVLDSLDLNSWPRVRRRFQTCSARRTQFYRLGNCGGGEGAEKRKKKKDWPVCCRFCLSPGEQRDLPVGNWVCVCPLPYQSLQSSPHSITQTITPFLLACATHNRLKLTFQPLTTFLSEDVSRSGHKVMHHEEEKLQCLAALLLKPNSLPRSYSSHLRARCYITD